MNHLQYSDISSQVGLHENHFPSQTDPFAPRIHFQTNNIVDKLGQSIIPQVMNETCRYQLNTTIQNFNSMMKYNNIYINARAESGSVSGNNNINNCFNKATETPPVAAVSEKKATVGAYVSYNNNQQQLDAAKTTSTHKNPCKNAESLIKFPLVNVCSMPGKSMNAAAAITTSATSNGGKSKFMIDVATMTDPLTPEEQERLCQWEGFAALQSGNKVAEYLTNLREFLKVLPPTEGRKRQGLGDVRIVTAPDGSRFFCCSECHMAYPDKSALEQHLANHKVERRFICTVCGAGLKRKEHLDRHQLSHSDERPYTCDSCPKTFKRNEHLARHYIVHSGEKGQVCTECGKAFYRRDHLQKHTQGHITKRLRLAIQSTANNTKTVF